MLDNILRKGVAEPYQRVAPLGRQVQVSRNVSVRELRAEVQTAIVTTIATSAGTELIRGHCAWEAFFLLQNFFRLTIRFVNSACRPPGVGVASDVQLSSHNRLREAVRAHAHASVCVCVCLRVRMRVHHVCARVCILSKCACMCPCISLCMCVCCVDHVCII